MYRTTRTRNAIAIGFATLPLIVMGWASYATSLI